MYASDHAYVNGVNGNHNHSSSRLAPPPAETQRAILTESSSDDQTFAVIPTEWISKYTKYIGYDLVTNKVAPIDATASAPSTIDTEPLHIGGIIRSAIVVGIDYQLIPSATASHLFDWFGVTTRLIRPALVAPSSNGASTVDLWAAQVHLIDIDDPSMTLDVQWSSATTLDYQARALSDEREGKVHIRIHHTAVDGSQDRMTQQTKRTI